MYWYLYCEICLIWIKLFSPLRALPPRCFENQRAATKWRLGRISTERRLIFQIQAVAKQLLVFESCLSGAFEDVVLSWKNLFVRRTLSMYFHFSRDIRKEQSCSISSGAKRHTLMASLQLELENAKRRERTDARPERPA